MDAFALILVSGMVFHFLKRSFPPIFLLWWSFTNNIYGWNSTFLLCGHTAVNIAKDKMVHFSPNRFIENLEKKNPKKVWCWTWIQSWGIFKWKIMKQARGVTSGRHQRFGMNNLSKCYRIHNLWKHSCIDHLLWCMLNPLQLAEFPSHRQA